MPTATTTTSPRPSTPRAEKTRTAILRAAGELFGEHGYAQVSMDEVAAGAGVTKPTVYAHFGSKEALFETLISDAISRSHGGDLAPAATIDEVAEVMFVWSSNRLDRLLADDTVGLMRAASAEGIRRPHWADKLLAGFDFGAMQRWLADLDAAGVLAVESPPRAASLFTALTKGVLFYPVLVAGQPITPKRERDAVIREAVRLFLAGHTPT